MLDDGCCAEEHSTVHTRKVMVRHFAERRSDANGITTTPQKFTVDQRVFLDEYLELVSCATHFRNFCVLLPDSIFKFESMSRTFGELRSHNHTSKTEKYESDRSRLAIAVHSLHSVFSKISRLNVHSPSLNISINSIMSAVYEMDSKEYEHLQTLPGNLKCSTCRLASKQRRVH